MNARPRILSRSILTALAVLISLAFLVPVLWLLASTFRSATETFASSSPLTWHVLWPQDWTLDNLRSAVDSGFLTALGNSLVVAAVTVVVGLVVSSAAAFALAVIPFRGRGVVFTIVVLSFLIPFEAIAIPLSRTFSDWGLANTLLALILPGLVNGLAVFTLRQFFLGIPPSLSEAAHLDGANWFRIYWSIVLPVARPALITSAVFQFVWAWTDFLYPLIYLNDEESYTLSIGLYSFLGQHGVQWGPLMAACVLFTLPAFLIFLVFQRYFIGGIATGALK